MINSSRATFSKPIRRDEFIALAHSAFRVKEFRFARQAALAWLAVFPGDLLVTCLLAEAYLGEGRSSQAVPILEKICEQDPEFLKAQELLAGAQPERNGGGLSTAEAHVYALKDRGLPGIGVPDWLQHIKAGQKALQGNDLEEAEKMARKALVANNTSPLPGIHHARIAYAAGDFQALQNLADLYHRRWPDCLQFSLYLADALLKNGDENQAVALLHQCAARDTGGQVPTRIWGTAHPYKPLWSEILEIHFDIPVPSAVAARMGWNQLEPGRVIVDTPHGVAQASGQLPAEIPLPGAVKSSGFAPAAASGSTEAAGDRSPSGAIDQSQPENLEDIHHEFERLASRIKRPNLARTDGRYPMYVLMSSKRGLEAQYGSQTTAILIDQMKSMAKEIRKRPGWGATVFFPDDSESSCSFDLKPIPNNDPWKIKLSLADLDKALGRRGQMIGALLIVGGAQAVPFHHLPNPTDDSDTDVPSDNPYATTDENYFIPEWPTTRLPAEAGSDACLLIEKIRGLTERYAEQARTHRWDKKISFWSRWFQGIQRRFTRRRPRRRVQPSFGYTAQAWRRPSTEVFHRIGKPQALLVSPPNRSGYLNKKDLFPAQIGYFNLHGIPDGAEWYGQKDVDDPSNLPDYPVAFSPKDILGSEQAPKIIFSEACYGALIEEKTSDSSLALKFLSSGTSALVGSTAISYGSVTTQLTAADLLAQSFWQQLREGQNMANALFLAKISLAREMNKRQGYLDGEDQKTLLSFVLYGDPLVTLEDFKSAPKSISRARAHPTIKTISDSHEGAAADDLLSVEIMAQVREVVQKYLPGLTNAELTLPQQLCSCEKESSDCPNCQFNGKAKGAAKSIGKKGVVITLTRDIKILQQVHHQYARLTLDPTGKVVKISSSR